MAGHHRVDDDVRDGGELTEKDRPGLSQDPGQIGDRFTGGRADRVADQST
jgi:hypothetical protein